MQVAKVWLGPSLNLHPLGTPRLPVGHSSGHFSLNREERGYRTAVRTERPAVERTEPGPGETHGEEGTPGTERWSGQL